MRGEDKVCTFEKQKVASVAAAEWGAVVSGWTSQDPEAGQETNSLLKPAFRSSVCETGHLPTVQLNK